jgi:hypothetical protein
VDVGAGSRERRLTYSSGHDSSSVSVGSFFYLVRYVGYIEVVVEGFVYHVPWGSCDTP